MTPRRRLWCLIAVALWVWGYLLWARLQPVPPPGPVHRVDPAIINRVG